jgi:hypothetical protein
MLVLHQLMMEIMTIWRVQINPEDQGKRNRSFLPVQGRMQRGENVPNLKELSVNPRMFSNKDCSVRYTIFFVNI